jgi:hypothetical protein
VIPWSRAIGDSRAIWLVIAIVALLFMALIAVGPVVNVNRLTITL